MYVGRIKARALLSGMLAGREKGENTLPAQQDKVGRSLSPRTYIIAYFLCYVKGVSLKNFRIARLARRLSYNALSGRGGLRLRGRGSAHGDPAEARALLRIVWERASNGVSARSFRKDIAEDEGKNVRKPFLRREMEETGSALPHALIGANGRIRTGGLRITSAPLCLLSHVSGFAAFGKMASKTLGPLLERKVKLCRSVLGAPTELRTPIR